jgi:hypothetical protein
MTLSLKMIPWQSVGSMWKTKAIVDCCAGPGQLFFRAESQQLGMDADDERFFVVTTVENPDPRAFRQTLHLLAGS